MTEHLYTDGYGQGATSDRVRPRSDGKPFGQGCRSQISRNMEGTVTQKTDGQTDGPTDPSRGGPSAAARQAVFGLQALLLNGPTCYNSEPMTARVPRIVANTEILGGKPIVEGTRLTVEHVVGLLAHGMTPNEIVEAYPELSKGDVNVVIQHAAATEQNVVPGEC